MKNIKLSCTLILTILLGFVTMEVSTEEPSDDRINCFEDKNGDKRFDFKAELNTHICFCDKEKPCATMPLFLSLNPKANETIAAARGRAQTVCCKEFNCNKDASFSFMAETNMHICFCDKQKPCKSTLLYSPLKPKPNETVAAIQGRAEKECCKI